MNTASITSDKPLFIKAVEIVQSNGMKVVCHLGGFHLLMNFLGAIGSIMAGSGLSQALVLLWTCDFDTHDDWQSLC